MHLLKTKRIFKFEKNEKVKKKLKSLNPNSNLSDNCEVICEEAWEEPRY